MTQTVNEPAVTQADLRSAIGRTNVKGYRIAARTGLNPSTLSLILNERKMLEPELGRKIMEAIEAESTE